MPPEGLPAVDGGETAVTLFRHTSASLLLAEGVPARVVMEILGHSQIGVTLNTCEPNG
jgi:site-specific recombinase XerD